MLTAEREAEMRGLMAKGERISLDDAIACMPMVIELLAELDRLRAKMSTASAYIESLERMQETMSDIAMSLRRDAEVAYARGQADERAAVCAWLDGVGTQYMQGDMVPCDEFVGEAYHQAKGEIERGEHVPDAGEAGHG